MKTAFPKIVMAGCHEAGFDIIKKLLESGIKITHFVTIRPALAKKLNVAGYISFARLAKKFKIKIYYARKYSLTHPDDVAFFYKHQFDLLIQGGWQRLFPESILKTLSIGAVGLHGSWQRLPKNRGRSPINWALIKNKKKFFIEYFLIKPGIDDGDIFHTEQFDITPWDDCQSVYYKYSMATERTLKKYIPKLLSGSFKQKKQKGKATYLPKRTPDDGLIDFSHSSLDIYNLVRAVTRPYPGAFCFHKNKKIYVWKAQPFGNIQIIETAKNGEVVASFASGDFVVQCRPGLLLVRDYEPRINLPVGTVLS